MIIFSTKTENMPCAWKVEAALQLFYDLSRNITKKRKMTLTISIQNIYAFVSLSSVSFHKGFFSTLVHTCKESESGLEGQIN